MTKPDRIAPEPRPASSSAGQLLSSARDDWDLSMKEVAQYLNLSVDTIKALEQDDYEQLPGATFVKGYVRSYAKLLKLDQEEVIACVNIEPDKMSEIPAARVSLKHKVQTQVRPKKSGRLFLRIILTIGILAGLLWIVINQLPNLDMNKISQVLKLPATTTQVEKSDEITFPVDNGQSDNSKGALIRIE